MDTNKLYSILRECCGQLRKGEVFEGNKAMVDWAKAGDAERAAPGGVLEVYMMPADTDPAFEDLEKVDLHFVTVAVNKANAERNRAALLDILNDWPEPEMLAGGPSYIAVGGVIGDQGAAFELFALGKVLGIWSIITPETLGMTGDMARDMAGRGFIMCSGYRPAPVDRNPEGGDGTAPSRSDESAVPKAGAQTTPPPSSHKHQEQVLSSLPAMKGEG